MADFFNELNENEVLITKTLAREVSNIRDLLEIITRNKQFDDVMAVKYSFLLSIATEIGLASREEIINKLINDIGEAIENRR